MIIYIEKGSNLHKVIAQAGYSLWMLNGIWYSTNDVAVQNIINAYNPLAATQAEALERIKDAVQTRLALITFPFPQNEIHTWPSQVNEAFAYATNPAVPTPMLSGIAAGSGQTVAALSSTVMAKYAAYTSSASVLIGLRIKFSNEVSAATDWTTIPAIILNALTTIG